MVVGIDLNVLQHLSRAHPLPGQGDGLDQGLRHEGSEQDGLGARTCRRSIGPEYRHSDVLEISETDFRREFTAELAERIARHFYAHDPTQDMAKDAQAGLN